LPRDHTVLPSTRHGVGGPLITVTLTGGWCLWWIIALPPPNSLIYPRPICRRHGATSAADATTRYGPLPYLRSVVVGSGRWWLQSNPACGRVWDALSCVLTDIE